MPAVLYAVPPLRHGPLPPPVPAFPEPPTRAQLCAVQLSFQGLKFLTPSYGEVYWWETLSWWPDKADRDCAYAAKRAAGDTHCILNLSGCYRENIPGSYNWDGADYTQHLDALVALALEAIREGFLIDLRLSGDGESVPGGGYNDPVGHTYGYQWLMDNLDRIMDAFADIYRYIVWVPGYDGVFYGWEPSDVKVPAFAAKIRSRFPDAVIGLEHNTGHIPIGEGGEDYLPGGRMHDYDVIYSEYDPYEYQSDSTWQIEARMVHPYHRPYDQPATDDPHPPFYLHTPNPRGPWFHIAFEILTYRDVRGQVSETELHHVGQYYADMGSTFISLPQQYRLPQRRRR